MKILVINAFCLSVNSSANLCHLAYINGLLKAGHSVTVLSSNSPEYQIDPGMRLPDEVTCIYVNGYSFYQRLSKRKNRDKPLVEIQASTINTASRQSIKTKILNKGKKAVLSLYGVHDINSTFVRKAKKAKISGYYDYVLSLSSPAASHLVAYNLLKSKKISCKHWIQIWEDPWYGDVYGFQNKRRIKKEEKKLLRMAEKVCYVSPLTLKNRQEIFSESAHKMYWQPLPYYYKNTELENNLFPFNQFGYFGDYVPASRDLEPFYIAAKNCKISVSICGNPSDLFSSTDFIKVYPRLPLSQLNKIEAKTNILVFLCNRAGGQIPGKIYQYSATNKTILFILDGTESEKNELKEYFIKFNRYIFCENNIEDIERAIKCIQENRIGTIINRPIDYFEPQQTVNRIFSGKNG